ncbi:MAG TPA: TonB-dependent receptor [Chitinophagaceae bacterium]|jgi:outer membrane receptor for ferrienterochelin and colicin|nr:TonB-dependent receptor [Chitinophagaceae bacterium]
MFFRISVCFLLLLTTLTTLAQTARLSGKVVNEKNEPLPGVTVKVTNAGSTTSDIDGNFSLNLAPGATYELTFTAVGYAAKTISEVAVGTAGTNELNVVLSVAARDLGGVTVTSRSNARRETAASLIQFQKNTNTVASVISAEAIRRSPDRNTGEVLKRVPGTSIQEGKYLVVRGLADRYNQAMLNGILLSSTEPDRKTFSFDLFPSQMIDNIIINKAFVPELPGEWAGGLVQVQTKEIPASNFLNLQIGTGFNTETIGKDFYQYQGGNTDWLGIEKGSRALPSGMPTKGAFAKLTQEQQNEWGKKFRNVWQATPGEAPLNRSFQLNGGFNGTLLKKKVGGILALTYNQSNRRLQFDNSILANAEGDLDVFYNNNRYSRDVLAGALANFSVQLNGNHRISVKNILNVNSSDFVVDRFDGVDNTGINARLKAQELGFRQNTFFNTQLVGEHNFPQLQTRLKWYGGFNILDQYIPDQRRLFYTQDLEDASAPYYALLGSGASQKSGSIFYSNLSDYIYNAGGDLSRTFDWLGQKQTVKAGYLFQVKDRLFDSRPFFLNTLSNDIKRMSPDRIFSPENFGSTADDVQFGELAGNAYRYMANSILNAGYLQFDNQLGRDWRLIWGMRVEDFDQLVGSVKQSDPRHVHTRVTDFLPGVNLTYKPNQLTNLRLSGSQTIVRPEFRELSPFAFYDFELNAQVVGNNQAERTKITNLDLRYEIYPRGGELLTFGLFFKHFDKPLEYYFNRTGPATNTFNVKNSDNARAYGAEFEFRKKLDFLAPGLKNFTATGNVSYIYSRVEDTTGLNRSLQGQSPYLVNLGLQYDQEKSGFSATLLFNQIGRRILFVGNEAIPNIWENPRPLLDLQLAQKVLNRRGEIRLGLSDLLNRRAYFYHDLDDNDKFKMGSADKVAIFRNYGTNVSLTFNYSFIQ